jgi:hypothetical protein
LAEVTINTTPVSGATAPAPATPPTFTPEENPSDIAKSYAELRAKFTQVTQENAALKKAQPAAPVETPPADAPQPNPNEPPKAPDLTIEDKTAEGDQSEAAKKVADQAGFDLNPFNEEYANTGDVAEESRAKIAEGLKNVLGPDARAIVDQFIEGQKAVHANDRRMAFEEAGGEEAYVSMVTWAKDALSKEEIAAYNKTVNSGDRHAQHLAIRGLRARYEAENGRIPNTITAHGGPTGRGTAPFASAAEMTAAMRDPRYKTDEAYRAQVAARIAASPNL